jgi:hypothetical protein
MEQLSDCYPSLAGLTLRSFLLSLGFRTAPPALDNSSLPMHFMTPRSCEYCFGSISWDARLVPVSSFRIGRLQYKRICVVSRFANAKDVIRTLQGLEGVSGLKMMEEPKMRVKRGGEF